LAVGPRLTWGISAALLVVGYFNTVAVSSLRRSKGLEEPEPGVALPSIEVGGGTPGNPFDRIATLLDEVERTRVAEESAGVSRRRSRGSGAANAPPR
jgi:hypothetical protein